MIQNANAHTEQKKPFVYPWIGVSLPQRLLALKQTEKKNLVYIYDKRPDCSTFRYRVYNMCETLSQSVDWFGTYFFLNEVNELLSHIHLIDQIILVRTPWTPGLDRLIQRAYAHNIHVHFDIDDLIYSVKDLPVFMVSTGLTIDDATCSLYFAYASRLYLSASLCDSLITTNAYLANALNTCFKKPVAVIPNFLNRQQLQRSEALWAIKQSVKTAHAKRFILGYFSGTASHQCDFESIAYDIHQLMTEYAQIKLRIVGPLVLPTLLQPWLKKSRIEQMPLMNYMDLQEAIANTDLNLIPLKINHFTHCKSEIKYFEAAVVGTLSMATPTFIYQTIIQPGKNGFLALQGAWYEQIKHLIEAPCNRSVIESARNHTLQAYTGSALLKTIEQIFKH